MLVDEYIEFLARAAQVEEILGNLLAKLEVVALVHVLLHHLQQSPNSSSQAVAIWFCPTFNLGVSRLDVKVLVEFDHGGGG